MAPRTGLRARVRAELTSEIKEEARRQLAESGAASLSLRSVTRSLGMAPSAIYRYFPSRDDLLTALLVDAYASLGARAEEDDARVAPTDVGGRWLAVGRGIRAWALARPHEYALLYGSPVPGYRAPDSTVGPASRVTFVLAAIVRDAHDAGVLALPTDGAALGDAEADAARLAELAMAGVPTVTVARALEAWTQLFGFVSFELFGHFVGVLEDTDSFFERALLDMGAHVGLPSAA
jgi:AcrR family transcriptional regulator